MLQSTSGALRFRPESAVRPKIWIALSKGNRLIFPKAYIGTAAFQEKEQGENTKTRRGNFEGMANVGKRPEDANILQACEGPMYLMTREV